MEVIVRMKFGSHLYGLNTAKSDTDYKVLYLPSIEELLLGTYKKSFNNNTNTSGSKNTKDDIDEEWIALPEFIKHAMSGQTFAIDMLHCTAPEQTSDVWENLVSKRKMFYSKDMKAYLGYVKQQAHKYGVKGSRLSELKLSIESINSILKESGDINIEDANNLFTGNYIKWEWIKSKSGKIEDLYYVVLGKMYQRRTKLSYVLERLSIVYNEYGERAILAEKNEGIDWKALSHAVRAGCQLREIYKNGDFSYPLNETQHILNIKEGNCEFSVVSSGLEQLISDVTTLSSGCDFPDSVDYTYWSNWLINVYKNKFNLELVG